MSGHSKWATIKRKKGKNDAARGKLFTKLIREITVAAREGGRDESGNPRLRSAILAAKAENMPAANMERAIKKGTGELPGESYESVIYEGYGAGGVAVMIEALTDNKNRTVAEMRHLFSKYGGNLAENGAVSWMFNQKGYITVDKSVSEDDLMLVALEAGAEDISDEEDVWEVTTALQDFERVKKSLEEAGIRYNQAELVRKPQTTVKVEGKTAEQVLNLMSTLEDHDDVQKVFSNFDIEAKELAALTA
ncbi:MAG: transcriptional regulator [Candidatus Handelsmanbacteria bacterium RIFCSPLOWO2_12_FULL_64_10]|uniref:Probable transcriptional regulatory protein A3F84_10855 n=1 Tax=Handelsmanbacteria sp. (strain RIFCSPLOWO2_12_FULL_64_10) TaxID=1817868 RepID=A0A1F6D6B5_HANXR|nr:MAG: transcriptional regulator [Candidatus Handelsmanbacteria bacterium RIFCSPLOWO2_12_FULL_64_10]